MSLTHQLDRRGTPVREFFETYFPASQFKPVSKAWYETVRAAPIVCEPPDGVNPGTIGTAFDYRARVCWALIDWKTTVAAGGMMNVFGLGRADLGMLALELSDELARVAPERCGGDLDSETEDRLSRCCYGLALYEQFFRTLAAATSSPLLQLGKKAKLDDVLALAPRAAVDDLAGMTRLLCERYPELVLTPAVLNPRFDGSVEIGGADADLIVDDALLELKTTKQDSFERVDHVYQLLGYALLDYTNKYKLQGVGIYLARRGVLVDWPIAELVDTCCPDVDWSTARAGFREAVSRVAASA